MWVVIGFHFQKWDLVLKRWGSAELNDSASEDVQIIMLTYILACKLVFSAKVQSVCVSPCMSACVHVCVYACVLNASGMCR